MKRSRILWFVFVVAAAITVVAVYRDQRSKKQLVQPSSPVCAYPTLSQDEPAICRSAYEGDTARLEQLLTSGVSIETKCSGERSPLYFACAMKRTAAVRLLLARGSSIAARDVSGGTPLLAAVAHGCTVRGRPVADDSELIVDLLLQRGAEVNVQDEIGMTPLSIAASNGLLSVARHLLAAGADVSLRDEDGLTAADWAKNNHREEIYQLLAEVEPSPASN